MIRGCMSFNGSRKMRIVILTINIHVYFEILASFLIQSVENWFGDDEVIFQEDNASCHR